MVNENHFRFDRKTFFNFWKTIYGFQNRKSFSEIKLFILTSTFDIQMPEFDNGQSSEYYWRWNSATSDHRRRMPEDQIPAGFGWIQPLIRPDLAKMAEIRPDLAKMAGIRPDWTILIRSGQTCSPESGNGDRTLPDSGENCIFSFRNFFMRTKH
jgi:hypothetical protein